MSRRLHLGISPCPNDTFAFHGLLTGAVDARGLELEIELADVESLNERLIAGDFDAAKASFYAGLCADAELAALPVGAALGFGVGPVLLAGRSRALPEPSARPETLVLCPGAWTTAHFLFRLLHPRVGRIEQCLFSEIMPALAAGRADFGVCIHEGRFTWRERGLAFVEDLGASFEARARAPLPLGGILARRALGRDVLRRLAVAIGDSIDYARAHPEEALCTMRRHAQEERDDVLWAHVDLYVNAWTRELGTAGRRALAALEAQARAADLLPAASARPSLEILDGRLFHVAPLRAWRTYVGGGAAEWRPASLEREGFVHLSFADQLEGTLWAHFAGEPELALLELDPARLGAALALEPARAGELFPHLRRALQRNNVARESIIQRGPHGWESPLASER